MRVVQVTKDNENRDRGFIAVDAICAAFENREQGNTQIMTMDGYWYDVLDDIEKVRNAMTGATEADAENQGEANDPSAETADKPKSRIRDFYKKYRMPSPAISEGGGTPPMDRKPEQEMDNEGENPPRTTTYRKFKKFGRYSKGQRFYKMRVFEPKGDETSINNDLPAVSGEGHDGSKSLRTDEPQVAPDRETEGL